LAEVCAVPVLPVIIMIVDDDGTSVGASDGQKLTKKLPTNSFN